MTHEEFKTQIKAISDLELVEKAELVFSKLNTIPSTEFIFLELIERFKKLSTKKTKEELLEQFALDFDYEKLKRELLKLDLSEKDLKDLEYLEDNNFIGIFNDLRDSKIKKREV